MFYTLKDNLKGEYTNVKTFLSAEKTAMKFVFKFDCKNSELFSAYSGYNVPVERGDCVGVIICVDKNMKEYFTIYVAPNGSSKFVKVTNKDGKGLNVINSFRDKNFTLDVEKENKSYKVKIEVSHQDLNYQDGNSVYFNAFRIETHGGAEKRVFSVNPTNADTINVVDKLIELNYC